MIDYYSFPKDVVRRLLIDTTKVYKNFLNGEDKTVIRLCCLYGDKDEIADELKTLEERFLFLRFFGIGKK